MTAFLTFYIGEDREAAVAQSGQAWLGEGGDSTLRDTEAMDGVKDSPEAGLPCPDLFYVVFCREGIAGRV